MDRELLTTREAAELLRVGTTSIKRWADSGLLACVKTPGGHRRFERHVLEHFRDQGVPPEDETDRLRPERWSERGPERWPERGPQRWIDRWLGALVGPGSPQEVQALLVAERDAAGTWAEAADVLGRVLEEIGERWARGELSVVQEHLASDRLARGLARCAEAITIGADAPVALLLTAEGDDHTLGLSLAEVVLRERGWAARWLGRVTPVRFAADLVAAGGVDLVCVSGSALSRDAHLLADQAVRLGAACDGAGATLILGGRGGWPARPRHGHRVRTFVELDELLAGRH